MRSRAQASEHAETVSRRLRLLSAELNGIRPPVEPLALDEPHTHLRELRPAGGEGASGADPAEAEPATTLPPSAESRAVAETLPPKVPVGGRHAARRGSSWLDLSPFCGSVSLTPTTLAVIAVVVAVGLGITAWWVVRDDPGVPVVAPTAGPALATPVTTAGATAPGSGVPSTDVVVDVTGKVRRPGIVVLPPGSRVVDAIKAAGGPRRGADLTGLNRARPVQDGEQIVVGVPAPPGVAASSVPSVPSSPGSTGDLVSLNTATTTELETLPGVGPVTAAAIVDWREANGGFASVDQLLEVDGIGEKTLAQLAPHVTL
ncbi:ComEA family DNA-binding protein [Nocardioides sp. JQ2195]|uniref:helix-hairpin-helix domain-containing protein n=1 Tax=Nocardioides sp. JQ2195 TaxID=2592334 RepID=UPI00143ED927|nr:helix-hairpin-helix domain-containing protein [Nocardioides sp. JQ2195]QIX27370.1 ComEA family DNA-binding protein [Nocardioides sp. JQ2195]